MKELSKKDTERIASHLAIVHDIISKAEDKYDDVCFSSKANCWFEDLVNAAGCVERVFNNSAQTR